MLLFLKARRTARRLSRAHCGVFQLTFSRERLTQASGVMLFGRGTEMSSVFSQVRQTVLSCGLGLYSRWERERAAPESGPT